MLLYQKITDLLNLKLKF